MLHKNNLKYFFLLLNFTLYTWLSCAVLPDLNENVLPTVKDEASSSNPNQDIIDYETDVELQIKMVECINDLAKINANEKFSTDSFTDLPKNNIDGIVEILNTNYTLWQRIFYYHLVALEVNSENGEMPESRFPLMFCCIQSVRNYLSLIGFINEENEKNFPIYLSKKNYYDNMNNFYRFVNEYISFIKLREMMDPQYRNQLHKSVHDWAMYGTCKEKVVEK